MTVAVQELEMGPTTILIPTVVNLFLNYVNPTTALNKYKSVDYSL